MHLRCLLVDALHCGHVWIQQVSYWHVPQALCLDAAADYLQYIVHGCVLANITFRITLGYFALVLPLAIQSRLILVRHCCLALRINIVCNLVASAGAPACLLFRALLPQPSSGDGCNFCAHDRDACWCLCIHLQRWQRVCCRQWMGHPAHGCLHWRPVDTTSPSLKASTAC